LADFSHAAGTFGSAGQITAQSSETGGQMNTTLMLTTLVRTNDPRVTVSPERILDLVGTEPWTNSGITFTNLPHEPGDSPEFQRRRYFFDAGTNSRAFLKLTVQQQ